MGNKEKNGKSTSRRDESEEEKNQKAVSQIEVVNIDSDVDDEDKEANADLSLKIVEKAMLRKCNKGSNSNGDSGNAVVLGDDEIVMNFTDDKSKKKEKKKNKRKKIEAELNSVSTEKDAKFEKFCSDLFLVDVAKEEEKVESEKAMEMVNEAVKANPVDGSDNVVLRKLLRGPRYFDPPDSSWGTCYNCGEEGHMSVNCTSARRKKPCFVCGSLEHNAKQCPKGQDCYICKKGGHRAKDCPEKSRKGAQNSKMCLKCGDSGHDMFSCRNNYSSDDLKEIECYLCGSFGHLCCVNYTDTGPRDISCYRCGLSGHTGSACTGSQGGTDSLVPLNSCYRCGEQGHFARECTNSSKGGNRNHELYTPKPRNSKENRGDFEVRSAPDYLGKTRKKKKTKHDMGFTSASKSKQKHGWITEDPGEFTSSKAKASHWRSPSTPNNKRYRTSDYSTPGYAPTYYSPGESHSFHYNNSASNRSGTFYQPRYTSWNSDYSPSYRSSSFYEPRYSSRNSSYSTLNGSAEFYQPRYKSRFDSNSSAGMRTNHGW